MPNSWHRSCSAGRELAVEPPCRARCPRRGDLDAALIGWDGRFQHGRFGDRADRDDRRVRWSRDLGSSAAHGASPNAGEVLDFTFGLITDTTGRTLRLGQTNDVLTPSAATHNLLRLSSQEWSGSEALRPPKAAPGDPMSCPTCKSLKAEFLAHSGSPANAFWLESTVDQESFARSISNP